MNVVKEINKINQRELDLGLSGASWHDEYKDSAYIFIGGLHYDLTEGDVITIFSQYGEVLDVNMPRDKDTGARRGFAFLMYEDQRSTVLAVDNLNGAKVLEKTLRVDHVKNYKQPKLRNEEGELVDPEEQSLNARPQMIDDGGAESDSSASSGASIDPEDPMRDYLIAQKKEAKALKKAKKSKDKGKHKDETPEERKARKARKKERKAKKAKSAEKIDIGIALPNPVEVGVDLQEDIPGATLVAAPMSMTVLGMRDTWKTMLDLTVVLPGAQAPGTSMSEMGKTVLPGVSSIQMTKTGVRTTIIHAGEGEEIEKQSLITFGFLDRKIDNERLDLTMEDFVARSVSHGLLKSHTAFDRARRDNANCEPANPANTVTDRLNNLLKNGGDGYTLSLCPNQTYLIQAPILFAHLNQEISTLGYPSDNTRATLSVSGPVSNGQGHTTAVDGTCSTCSGVKLRHVQIDGTRRGAPPTNGGANIEMGGSNSNQLIEFVRSHDPRSWSCLHVAEGPLTCNGVVIQNNDIGPCGSDQFQQWADGISVSCRNAIVRNNMVQDPTDGGIVVFGSPGTQVYNNTIWILNATLLGGINMVDYDPWSGDYTGTVVHDNTIYGGFAEGSDEDKDGKGTNPEGAIVKIGIAVGPRTWFGDKYGNNVSRNGNIHNNRLTGAFSYGMAISSATNFTVQDNVMFGNTSFIGARGPNCSSSDVVPSPGPFIVDLNTTKSSSLQSSFVPIDDGNSLTCVLPPNGGDFWPEGLNPSNTSSSTPDTSGAGSSSHSHPAGIAIGVVLGVIFCAIAAWFVRKYVMSRREATRLFNSTRNLNYTQRI